MAFECEQTCRNNVMLGIMWMLLIALAALNFLAFYHDYTRYREGILIELLGIPMTYKTFAFVAGLGTVFLDGWAFKDLLSETPPSSRWNNGFLWVIGGVFIAVGFGVILYNYLYEVPIEEQNKTKDPVLSTRGQRVALYVSIMLIGIAFGFLSFSFELNKIIPDEAATQISGYADYMGKSIKLGAESCKRQGLTFKVVMILLLGLAGSAADGYSAYAQYAYIPEDYGLPQAWD